MIDRDIRKQIFNVPLGSDVVWCQLNRRVDTGVAVPVSNVVQKHLKNWELPLFGGPLCIDFEDARRVGRGLV